MNEAELAIALLEIFDLGWQIGRYDARNSPISAERIRKDKAKEFQRRNELMQQIKDHFNRTK